MKTLLLWLFLQTESFMFQHVAKICPYVWRRELILILAYQLMSSEILAQYILVL